MWACDQRRCNLCWSGPEEFPREDPSNVQSAALPGWDLVAVCEREVLDRPPVASSRSAPFSNVEAESRCQRGWFADGCVRKRGRRDARRRARSQADWRSKTKKYALSMTVHISMIRGYLELLREKSAAVRADLRSDVTGAAVRDDPPRLRRDRPAFASVPPREGRFRLLPPDLPPCWACWGGAPAPTISAARSADRNTRLPGASSSRIAWSG